MVQVTLVEEQLADGRKLIVEFMRAGIDVTAAAWIRKADDDAWYLYVASPLSSRPSRANPYLRLHEVIRQQPQPFWVQPLDVQLIDPDSPVARDILAIQRKYPPTKSPLHFGEGEIGGTSTEGAYIYPPPSLLAAE